MAQPSVKPIEGVVERNIALTGAVMRCLMEHPNVVDALPDDFELVILPDDDPEIRLHNLELLDARASSGKPVVFARLKSHEEKTGFPTPPSLFVPLAV